MIGRTLSSTQAPHGVAHQALLLGQEGVEVEIVHAVDAKVSPPAKGGCYPRVAVRRQAVGRVALDYTFDAMSVFLGGSAYNMVRDIADGYIITTELTFKKFKARRLPDVRLRGRQAPARDPRQRRRPPATSRRRRSGSAACSGSSRP